MDGVLVVDKPKGPTSHDVVAVVRRALRINRAGHTGTLDPLATGVLAIVIGRATRLASFLSGADKEYLATIRFGASTPTYDAESIEEVSLAPSPPAADIAAALPDFVGTYLQQPPPFSAKKIAGTAAYKLARKGKPAAIAPSKVTVHALELRSYADGAAIVRVVCSGGFYVRSLAHDLGQRLGTGAFLDGLRRTRAGAFGLSDAVPLDAVAAAPDAAVRDRLVPMERMLPQMPAVRLSVEGVKRASHGNALSDRDFIDRSGIALWEAPDAPVQLLDSEGRLIGIATPRGPALLHPSIVLV